MSVRDFGDDIPASSHGFSYLLKATIRYVQRYTGGRADEELVERG